jgi:hypothetical protein
MLMWDHHPERRSRSWRSSILVQRDNVHQVLDRNPGLKSSIALVLQRAYRAARLEAGAETNLDDDTFPLECPYSWDEIMERPVSWPPAD